MEWNQFTWNFCFVSSEIVVMFTIQFRQLVKTFISFQWEQTSTECVRLFVFVIVYLSINSIQFHVMPYHSNHSMTKIISGSEFMTFYLVNLLVEIRLSLSLTVDIMDFQFQFMRFIRRFPIFLLLFLWMGRVIERANLKCKHRHF